MVCDRDLCADEEDTEKHLKKGMIAVRIEGGRQASDESEQESCWCGVVGVDDSV
jgi:hypothetical protein